MPDRVERVNNGLVSACAKSLAETKRVESLRDAGSGWHDPLPTLYSALAICHSVGQSLREHMGHLVAIAGDMNWDGEHIDGMSNDDAMLLTGLGAPAAD